jgi:hypothetical protein
MIAVGRKLRKFATLPAKRAGRPRAGVGPFEQDLYGDGGGDGDRRMRPRLLEAEDGVAEQQYPGRQQEGEVPQRGKAPPGVALGVEAQRGVGESGHGRQPRRTVCQPGVSLSVRART